MLGPDADVPRRPARGDRGGHRRRRRGRSSSSGPAGARASCTGSRPASGATQGHGPTLIVSPLLAPDAQPDRDGGAARARGGDDQLRQRRRVARDRGPPRPRRDRRPADLPGAARERGLHAAASCPSIQRRDRPARHRRGPLHLATGATTSAPTTGGSAGSCRCSGRTCPVLATTATANDRVVADVAAQLGERRRGHPRAARPRHAPARRDPARRPGASGSPGSPRTCRGCRAAGSSTA